MFIRKAAGTIRLVVKNIFYMGFTAQIFLGFVWMAGNFGEIQDFPAAARGIYSFLVNLAGQGYRVICLLQLLTALYAGYRLLRYLRVGEAWRCVWGSLALMTLPMAMQCHMALLPYSFVCSLELLKISCVCESAGGREDCTPKGLAGMAACYAAQCLLWPEYWAPGVVLPLLVFFWKMPGMLGNRKQRLKGCALVLCLLAAAAAGCSLRYGTRDDADSGGSALSWTLVKRVCWPTLWVDWEGTPEGVREAAADVVWTSAHYPHHMDLYFKPALDAAMSPDDVDSAMWEMVKRSWQNHYSLVIRQIGWDVLGYGVTPLILPKQLEGDAYDSCSGRNYEIMRNEMPVLTKYYVRLSCGWFGVSLAMALLASVLACIGRTGRLRCEATWAVPVMAVLFSAVASVLYFTVQGAGIMDYKYTVWVNQLWILWGIKIVSGEDASA